MPRAACLIVLFLVLGHSPPRTLIIDSLTVRQTYLPPSDLYLIQQPGLNTEELGASGITGLLSLFAITLLHSGTDDTEDIS